MNNVIDLNVNTNSSNSIALRERGYGDAGFDVQYHSLYAVREGELPWARVGEYSQLIPNRVVSIREDTQDVLGIHSLKYKGVNFKDGIDRCRDIIIKSDLADDSIIEEIRVTPNSKQCVVSYTLPNVIVDTPDGDTAALMIIMTNSFNGVWAFSIQVGLKQWACFNTQISATDGLVYKSRHNRFLNLDHAVSVITKSIPILHEQTELWREWLSEDCTDYNALKIIGTVTKNQFILNNYLHPTDIVLNDDEVRRSKNVAHLWGAWEKYKVTLGSNMWAMYNTLTDWSTHVETKKSGSVASIRSRRENIVKKIISDPNLFEQKIAA
jgi:hypothetical protein